VLSTDRNGKPIQHGGKRGTNVTMADGSVRFVSAKVSDAVFQAMCTVNGSTPPDFDLNKNPETALLPKQEIKREDRTPVAVTPKAAPAATALSGEAKAFHEGVLRVYGGMKDLENQSEKALLALGTTKDKAQFEAAVIKLADQTRALIKDGRSLKAPPSKEGQEYGAAFTAILDLNQQALDVDLKAFLEFLRNPTPDAQAKILQSAQAKAAQGLAATSRFETAQRAFLAAQSAPQTQAAPAAAPPAAKTSQNNLPAGWISFNVPGAGFSVALPNNPQTFDQKTPDGKTVKVYLAIEAATQNAHTITYIAGVNFGANSESEFRNFTAGYVNSTGQKLISEKAITVGTAPGREYQFQDPKLGKFVHMRAIAAPGGLISIAAMTDQPQATENVQAFLNSVKIGG
jgi:prepilin-type processing-associated H-X9-DG protein